MLVVAPGGGITSDCGDQVACMPQIIGDDYEIWLAGALLLVGFGWADAAAVAAAGTRSVWRSPARGRRGAAGERPLPLTRWIGDAAFTSRTTAKPFSRLEAYATLRVWETSTGRLLREVRPEPVYVRAVVFPPDAKHIALEGGRRIEGDSPGYEEVRRLVDTASGKELRRFKMADGDGDQVLAITPDGKYLLSLGNLGVLRIEEIATGTEFLEQKFPRVQRCRDWPSRRTARRPASGAGKLYLWDWQEGGKPRELKVPRYGLHDLTFSPDGKSLVACGSYESYV